MNAAFDTLAAARDLKKAGFANDQAEACHAAAGAEREQLATKADITVVKADIATVKAELRADLAGAINKMLLAQVAIAGLLFAALKLWG